MKSFFAKVISVIIALFSFYVMYLGDFETFSIVIGTIILIAGVTFYIMSSPKTYNDAVSSTKQLTNDQNKTIEDFYNTFKDKDSVLGKPWLGKIKTIKGKCLIFGPTVNGDFLYMHKMFGKFFIASNPIAGFIDGPKEEMWRLETPEQTFNILSDQDAVCYSLLTQSALDDIFHVLDTFAMTGAVNSFPTGSTEGKVYFFNEDFKVTGQRFYLTDFDGNPLYEIDSTFPMKTFYMKDYKSGETVFKITKRLLHFLDNYDFYLYGNEYGTFKQKIDFTHDTFVMETTDGTLEMKSINDTLGVNNIVKLNGKVIATIAERLNINLHNLVFDNFVLHVREDRHLPLIAGLAVMAARELRRDTTDIPD